MPEVCYAHDRNPSVLTIQGKSCQDEQLMKIKKHAQYCPFNTEQYMWVNEAYQG